MSKTFIYGGLLLALLVAPFVGYPMFLMKVLCFALFASAFSCFCIILVTVYRTNYHSFLCTFT
jgi:hypothetical protein